MTDDLIEQLARRSYEAYWAPTVLLTGRTLAPWEPQPDAEKKAWRSVAAECLRQMEWAYEMRARWIYAGFTMRLPLTLAPPEWKP